MRARLGSVLLASVSAVLLVLLTVPSSIAQIRLDDVHVAPLEKNRPDATANQFGGAHPYAIRKDVNLVLVPVTVTDQQQRLVTGLSRDNFVVFDGKKSQEIQHFSNEDAPVSVGIIVDTSGSMKDKMERVQEAVHVFCESANVQDEFFMITFADTPELAHGFTDSPSEIESHMIFAQPKGRTALLDAIYMGINEMRHARYSKKAMLVISDGGDNHSRYGEREVKSALEEADVALYAIGTFDRYVPTQEELLGPELLSKLAEPTGGRAFTISNIEDLAPTAHRIGTELRVQYVLGYRPSNSPTDGKWHKIHVKLRAPRKVPFLQAHAKKGYYAQAAQPEIRQNE